jgi:hypothetical protein
MNLNFKEIIPKTKSDVIEDIAIIVVELFAPPVMDDLIEHQLHSLNKSFSKNICNKSSSLDDIKEYCSGVISFLKKDIGLIKKISCHHHAHASTMKEFIERSLIKNGFEQLIQTGVVIAVGVESLPVLIGAVAIAQTFEYIEKKNEKEIVDNIKLKISSFRDKFLTNISTSDNKLKI